MFKAGIRHAALRLGLVLPSGATEETSVRPMLVPLLFAFVVCFSHISQGTLAVDAIRYGNLASQLTEHWNPFALVDPYDGGQYANKPPMLFALMAALFDLVGFSTATAKLPAASFVFAALMVVWFIARRSSEVAGLLAMLLLVANRSFSRDLVEVGFDGIAVAAVVFVILGVVRVTESNAARVSDALLIGVGVALLMQSKPPYVALLAPGLLAVVVISSRARALLTTPGALVALLFPIALAASWYVAAGLEYLQKAADNQVAESLDLKRGFFANLGAWVLSFLHSLAPLSLVTVFATWVRARQCYEKRALDAVSALLLLTASTLIPIMLLVALRPRYLWVPLVAGSILSGVFCAERLPRLKAHHMRRVLLSAAAILLVLVAGGIQLHRGDETVLLLRRHPDLLSQPGLVICVEDGDEESTRRGVQNTTLLTELEFAAAIPVVTPATLGQQHAHVVANRGCAAVLRNAGFLEKEKMKRASFFVAATAE